MFCEQHFHLAAKKLARGRIGCRYELCSRAAPVSKQARRQHTAVVQHQQIVLTQKLREIAKGAILKAATPAIPMKHSRRRTIGQWLLGDQLFRQVVVEIGYKHTVIMPDGLRPDMLCPG